MKQTEKVSSSLLNKFEMLLQIVSTLLPDAGADTHTGKTVFYHLWPSSSGEQDMKHYSLTLDSNLSNLTRAQGFISDESPSFLAPPLSVLGDRKDET